MRGQKDIIKKSQKKNLTLDFICDISALESKDIKFNRNVAASCPRRTEYSCRIYLRCICSLTGVALANLQLPVLITELHILLEIINKQLSRSQGPRGIRRRSTATRLLRLRVRMLPGYGDVYPL